ncbi:MAG TPA: PEP-CTERM sorting domain-containing protein [Tepidisphaeraceae bacterium]|nr:PEP-CTERM sorting domain-containing protein [Tepidisphaeraceae bacterium]
MSLATRRSRSLAAVAIFVCGAAGAAEAGYIADFDTTGSAADFAPFQINNTDDGDPSGTGDNTDFSVNSGGGNAFLRTQVSPPAGGSGTGAAQVRYQVAPSNFEGAEVAIPTGMTGDPVRTEARLTTTIREIFGGDDLPNENPFTQFGFTEFDPVTNTPDYASKIIVQITNALTNVTLSHTTNNAGGGTTTLGNFSIPGGTYTPGDTLELQVTNDQVRLLYNGTALADTDGDYQNLPVDFFSANFDAGDQLIPFFGLIRGSTALEDADVIGAGFDNISAQNVLVPEPASTSLLVMAGVALMRRRRQA